MKRRARAIAFLLAAAVAAAAAAGLADSYGASAVGGYGVLRRVVVASAPLRAGRAIDPADLAGELELRRVPARFVPHGALREVAEAVGLAPLAPVPAGSYLLASQLRAPRRNSAVRDGLAGGRAPVQIAVSGAEALLGGAGAPPGSRVDVVVTTEPTGAGPGRVYVAAAAVPLLSLAPADPEGDGTLAATLGLTRRQALRLIAAESFARQVTLLPRG